MRGGDYFVYGILDAVMSFSNFASAGVVMPIFLLPSSCFVFCISLNVSWLWYCCRILPRYPRSALAEIPPHAKDKGQHLGHSGH